MLKINKRLLNKILLSVFCAAIGYLFFIQTKLLGIDVFGIMGSAIFGIIPIVIDWLNKYNEILDGVKIATIKRDEEIRSLKNEMSTLVADINGLYNRGESFADEGELNKVRAEAYSARGEAQQALNIVGMALEQSSAAQRRINDLLSSGIIFKLCETVTRIEIKQELINSQNNKDLNI
jgi:hypothetical protein